jgi:hypothetical protein
MSKSGLVDIACFVRMETPRAFLINDGHREVWIPKSQCEVEQVGDKSSICTMPEWLAKKCELI